MTMEQMELMPREKALKFGVKALSDVELLAILFATGVQGMGVRELCAAILAHHKGHLSKLAGMSADEICRTFKGIGPAKALTLLAALELGARAREDKARLIMERTKLTAPDQVYAYMQPQLQGLNHEEFWIIFFNRSGAVINKTQIGKGGIAATVVDIRLIMREALLNMASAMILVHNHPSGNVAPSPQDETLTRKICEAAKFHDIAVNDHLIFTDAGYYSFHDQGKL